MKHAGKSVLAVLGGYIAAIALTGGVGFVMYQIWDLAGIGKFEWHHPPYYSWATLTMDLGRLVLALVGGGFVASRIARRAPIWHAAAVGALILGPMAAQGFPDPTARPAWYWLATLAAIVPAALLGGWLSSHRRRVMA